MPLFEEENQGELRSYLIDQLKPIWDGDPDVLADYVLALLKHEGNDEELQTLLSTQLVDFLSDDTSSFVPKLFKALKEESYLTSKAPVPDARSIPDYRNQTSSSSPNASSRGTKRGAEEDDDRRRANNKQPRAASPGLVNAPKGPRAMTATADFADRRSEERRDGRDREQKKQSGKKEPCRDYHFRGFCPRGANCQYDHSPNVALPQNGQPGVAPNGFPPNMGMGMGPMNPMMLPPGFQPPPGFAPPMGFPPGFGPPSFSPPQGGPGGAPGGVMGRASGSPDPSMFTGVQNGGATSAVSSPGPSLEARLSSGNVPMAPAGIEVAPGTGRGGFGGRGRGSGRGGRGTFKQPHLSKTTLVIENVPPEALNLMKVNEHFSKFGTITNISIDVPNSKALVSFSNHGEAQAAHESPEVVFGNRFVKVYFQRVETPTPTAPPVVATPVAPVHAGGSGSSRIFNKPAAAVERQKQTLQATLELQKQKQALLDKQIAEQKALMEKLTKPDITAEEKQEIMKAFKKLDEEVKTTKTAVAISSKADAGAALAKERAAQREAKVREQLDRELEAHTQMGAGGKNTDALKAKLAELQAEAASLGIEDVEQGGSAGGYNTRGRGRGRGGYYQSYNPRARGFPRARGGANRVFKLDNRTTKVAVSGLPEGASKESVQEHLKQFGDVDAFTDTDSGFVVAFKTRSSAEQALHKGTNIPDVGQVSMSWFVEPAASSTPSAFSNGASVGATESISDGAEDASGNAAVETGEEAVETAEEQGEEEEEDEDKETNWKR